MRGGRSAFSCLAVVMIHSIIDCKCSYAPIRSRYSRQPNKLFSARFDPSHGVPNTLRIKGIHSVIPIKSVPSGISSRRYAPGNAGFGRFGSTKSYTRSDRVWSHSSNGVGCISTQRWQRPSPQLSSCILSDGRDLELRGRTVISKSLEMRPV